MTVRRIVPWPDTVLNTPAEPVTEIDENIRLLWTDMIDTMEAMPGVGLAAPQIGIGLRLAVVDASDERGRAIRMANPETVASSAEMSSWPEASPNLPGVHAEIRRPARVTVRFVSENGQTVEQDFEGLWATSVQHQIDHLEGRMYFDSLSRTRRSMLLKRARKVAK